MRGLHKWYSLAFILCLGILATGLKPEQSFKGVTGKDQYEAKTTYMNMDNEQQDAVLDKIGRVADPKYLGDEQEILSGLSVFKFESDEKFPKEIFGLIPSGSPYRQIVIRPNYTMIRLRFCPSKDEVGGFYGLLAHVLPFAIAHASDSDHSTDIMIPVKEMQIVFRPGDDREKKVCYSNVKIARNSKSLNSQ